MNRGSEGSSPIASTNIHLQMKWETEILRVNEREGKRERESERKRQRERGMSSGGVGEGTNVMGAYHNKNYN